MSKDTKPKVDTSSAEFKEKVEAALNSGEDTKKWKAGPEVGQELKRKGETKEPIYQTSFNESSSPLFMRDREGNKGNAQDEKDETEE